MLDQLFSLMEPPKALAELGQNPQTQFLSVPKAREKKQKQSTAHIALVCAFSHGQWVGRSRKLAGHVGPVVLANGTTKGFGRTCLEATDTICVCPKRQRQRQEQSTAHIALVCAFSHGQWVGQVGTKDRSQGPSDPTILPRSRDPIPSPEALWPSMGIQGRQCDWSQSQVLDRLSITVPSLRYYQEQSTYPFTFSTLPSPPLIPRSGS